MIVSVNLIPASMWSVSEPVTITKPILNSDTDVTVESYFPLNVKWCVETHSPIKIAA